MPADEAVRIFSPIFLSRMRLSSMRRGDTGQKQMNAATGKQAMREKRGPVFLSEKIRRASVLYFKDAV
jgi:hypothetical protein